MSAAASASTSSRRPAITTVAPHAASSPAAARRAHRQLDRVPRHQLRTAHVEPRDRAPALRLDRLRRYEVLAAGVVDQHVEPPVALEAEPDDPLGVLRLTDVAGTWDAEGPISSTAATSTDSRRPAITTRAPQAASSRAAALPRPVPPPVTRITRSSRTPSANTEDLIPSSIRADGTHAGKTGTT